MDKRLFGFILAIFILLNIVSVALGVNNIATMTPANSTVINGTASDAYNFSVTMDAAPGNISNVTFYWSTNFTQWLMVDSAVNGSNTPDGECFSVMVNTSLVGEESTDARYILINATGFSDAAGTVAEIGGNISSIDVDNTNIAVTLNGPADAVWNKSNASDSVIFEYTPLDDHISVCYLWLAGDKNATNSSGVTNNSVNTFSIGGIADTSSTVNWTVLCNETSGASAGADRTYKKDATDPVSDLSMSTVRVIGAQRPIKITCEGDDTTSGVWRVSASIKNPRGKIFTQIYEGNEETFEFRGVEETGASGKYTAWCTVEDNTQTDNAIGQVSDSDEETFTVLASLGKGRAVPVEEVAPEEEVEEGITEEEGAAITPEEVAGKAGLWITLIIVLAIIVIIYFAVKRKKR